MTGVGTLYRYITMRMLFSISALFIVFSGLILLIEIIENMRFAGKFADGSFLFAATLALLRTPGLIQTLAPFLFLFSAIWVFNQLNRRSEIAVMRSAGLSIWRLVTPPAILSVLAGIFLLAVADPLATRMLAHSETLKNDIRGQQSSIVRVLGDGIWFRQNATNSILIINAAEFDSKNDTLREVVVWRMSKGAGFRERIDADEAKLLGDFMELYNARLITTQDRLNHESPVYTIDTTLTPDDLRQRVASPESMSVFELSRFTELAEAAGLPTIKYYLRFHDLISTPLKLLAMVLIAAIFSLRPTRAGGAGRLLAYSIGTGFLLYVVSEVSVAIGESGVAPVALAAWTPAIVATLIAIAGLMHFEEG